MGGGESLLMGGYWVSTYSQATNYVWREAYIDAMVLRDAMRDGNEVSPKAVDGPRQP